MARLGKPYIYICLNYLADFATLIIIGGLYFGTIVAGQFILKNDLEVFSYTY